MSRDRNYQRLLNSPRWREVKTQVWRRANGLCERCIREGKAAGVPDGYITPGVDCHHIKPVESARTVMEMEQLCYNPANIELLCVPCHIKTHQEMRSHSKEAVKARAEQRHERWKDNIMSRFMLPAHSESEYVDYEEVTADPEPPTPTD